MKTKGVDVRSVMNCAKQSKLQTVEFRSVPPEKEIWQHIPFEQLTLKNQDQFLLKCKEVAVITALKTKRTNKRKNTRMRELRNKILVSKVQSITDVRSFEPQTTVLSVADRANIYLKTLT